MKKVWGGGRPPGILKINYFEIIKNIHLTPTIYIYMLYIPDFDLSL